MSIDKMAQGICPKCGELRGSLWKDKTTGAIVASCVVCRRGESPTGRIPTSSDPEPQSS